MEYKVWKWAAGKNEESDDKYKEERNHNTDNNKDNTNQGVEEMADMIDKLQEDFEEIRHEGEEIMESRRSTHEKREVEWYTYTQQMKYNKEQYSLCSAINWAILLTLAHFIITLIHENIETLSRRRITQGIHFWHPFIR